MRCAPLGWVIVSCLTAACGATAEPLFSAVPDAEGSAVDAGAGTTDAAAQVVRAGMRLQYQLTGTVDTDADADVFVIDLFETERAELEHLHGQGRVAIAYVAAGSYEPWRPDADALPRAAIGEPLGGYPEEAWLDVRDPSVRQLLVGRLTLAADKGFDGVLLASLDAYLAESGHDLSADDQLAYNVWLAERAAQVGLAAGISSDWGHASQLAEHYAFAVAVGCMVDQSCAVLAPYQARGRAVFDLETGGESASVCAEAKKLNLPVTFKNETFDAWFLSCR